MSEEVPHRLLIRVEVMATDDAQAIVRAEQMVNDHPTDTKVINFQYLGLAETPETRNIEDEGWGASLSWRDCRDCQPKRACPVHREEAAAFYARVRATDD